jgi:membrane-associated phospholipid phosphatase
MHSPGARSVALAVTAVAWFACSDSPAAPERATPALAATPFETELLSTRWQERARSLVRTHAVGPVPAGRVYAGLSIAQYRAVVAADPQASTQQPRGAGFGAGGRSGYEALRGAVSGASVAVLSFLFPAAATSLESQVLTDAGANAGEVHPSFTRGLEIGRAAGAAMVTQLQNDGFTLPWTGTLPVGPQYWTGTPVAANLGAVTPYLINSTSQFRAAPHPAFNSPEFLAALDEVLTISQNRTPQQIAIALKWATAGAGSTPLGYWNELAGTYITEAGLSEREATRVFALTHAAQFDAQLTCFESKYFYALLRPNQADPAITTVTAQPSYPSYPSGHACISSSAAHVLKHFFPAHSAELTAQVLEASESRLYAGIHYRFDQDASRVLGVAVANWAIAHEDRLF